MNTVSVTLKGFNSARRVNSSLTAAMRSEWATIAGHRWLLFDAGGVIAAVGMYAMAIATGMRHTAELYRQEPLA